MPQATINTPHPFEIDIVSSPAPLKQFLHAWCTIQRSDNEDDRAQAVSTLNALSTSAQQIDAVAYKAYPHAVVTVRYHDDAHVNGILRVFDETRQSYMSHIAWLEENFKQCCNGLVCQLRTVLPSDHYKLLMTACKQTDYSKLYDILGQYAQTMESVDVVMGCVQEAHTQKDHKLGKAIPLFAGVIAEEFKKINVDAAVINVFADMLSEECQPGVEECKSADMAQMSDIGGELTHATLNNLLIDKTVQSAAIMLRVLNATDFDNATKMAFCESFWPIKQMSFDVRNMTIFAEGDWFAAVKHHGGTYWSYVRAIEAGTSRVSHNGLKDLELVLRDFQYVGKNASQLQEQHDHPIPPHFNEGDTGVSVPSLVASATTQINTNEAECAWYQDAMLWLAIILSAVCGILVVQFDLLLFAAVFVVAASAYLLHALSILEAQYVLDQRSPGFTADGIGGDQQKVEPTSRESTYSSPGSSPGFTAAGIGSDKQKMEPTRESARSPHGSSPGQEHIDRPDIMQASNDSAPVVP